MTTPQCFVKGVIEPITQTLLTNHLNTHFGPLKDLEIVRSKACAFFEFLSLDAARRAIATSLPQSHGGEGGVWIDCGPDVGNLRCVFAFSLFIADARCLIGLGFRSRRAKSEVTGPRVVLVVEPPLVEKAGVERVVGVVRASEDAVEAPAAVLALVQGLSNADGWLFSRLVWGVRMCCACSGRACGGE